MGETGSCIRDKLAGCDLSATLDDLVSLSNQIDIRILIGNACIRLPIGYLGGLPPSKTTPFFTIGFSQ